MMISESDQMAIRLNRAIPGGAHTYSRGRDQFPGNAPALFVRGKGSYLYDRHLTKYLDFGMGLRSVVLGYAHPRVTIGAVSGVLRGNSLTGPSQTELLAAEDFLSYLEWPDMVKFAKNGSNVTTAAIKLARAHTGRDGVLVPSDQPFFSFDDWFIGSTVMSRGTLTSSAQTTRKFDYGNMHSVETSFDASEGNIAAIILEPMGPGWDCNDATCFHRSSKIELESNACSGRKAFIFQLRKFCDDKGIVLIFDEMISGFRWSRTAGVDRLGVVPDLATFGKAVANGSSVAALVGKRELMSLGSIDIEGMERVFLLSSTHGAEMSSLGALRAVLWMYRRQDVVGKLWRVGEKICSALSEAVSDAGVSDSVRIGGAAVSPILTISGNSDQDSQRLRSIFLEEMVDRRVLIPWISPSIAHSSRDIEVLRRAAFESFVELRRAVDDSSKEPKYRRLVKPVFRKYS